MSSVLRIELTDETKSNELTKRPESTKKVLDPKTQGCVRCHAAKARQQIRQGHDAHDVLLDKTAKQVCTQSEPFIRSRLSGPGYQVQVFKHMNWRPDEGWRLQMLVIVTTL